MGKIDEINSAYKWLISRSKKFLTIGIISIPIFCTILLFYYIKDHDRDEKIKKIEQFDSMMIINQKSLINNQVNLDKKLDDNNIKLITSIGDQFVLILTNCSDQNLPFLIDHVKDWRTNYAIILNESNKTNRDSLSTEIKGITTK